MIFLLDSTDKMKNTKYCTMEAIPKSNRKITKRREIDNRLDHPGSLPLSSCCSRRSIYRDTAHVMLNKSQLINRPII